MDVINIMITCINSLPWRDIISCN